MPPEEAGYTYAVEPAAIDRLLANEEESIYGPSQGPGKGQSPAMTGPSISNARVLILVCDRLSR
jgi:hypothetical protein